MRHKKGHLKDRPDGRDWYEAELIADVREQALELQVPEVGPIDPYVNLSQYVGDMWDQMDANACVGFALARATHMRGLIQGYEDMGPPSPFAIYALARMAEKPLIQPLQDTGCFPRDACNGIQKWGLTPWDRWPSEPQNVNVAPTPEMLRDSADYRAASYYSIETSDANARIAAIKRALTAKVPLTVAFQVDNTFENFDGSHVMPNFDGTYNGSHYVTLIGYDDDAFLICNSWGQQWGFGGFAWVSEARIVHPTTTDIRAVLVVPDLDKS